MTWRDVADIYYSKNDQDDEEVGPFPIEKTLKWLVFSQSQIKFYKDKFWTELDDWFLFLFFLKGNPRANSVYTGFGLDL